MESRRTTQSAVGTRGFTLIELTVVIMILVAMAGIMVPMLSGYVERSHSGAAATNIGEIAKQIELYKVKTLVGYPDNWDSLVDGSTSAIWSGVPTAAATKLSVLTLTADTLASLQSAGINNIVGPPPAGGNATYDSGVSAPLAVGSSVAQIVCTATDSTSVAALRNVVPNADPVKYYYILLGLGGKCTAVGTVMAEAPVHFDTLDPAKLYQHYGAIFAVPQSGGGPVKLATVVGIHDGGLSGLKDHLREYNDAVEQDAPVVAP